MIRQQAFTKPGKFLKGGLHCHTTRSDGELSPADTLRFAARDGYDFMALTDHQLYNLKNFIEDRNLIRLSK